MFSQYSCTFSHEVGVNVEEARSSPPSALTLERTSDGAVQLKLDHVIQNLAHAEAIIAKETCGASVKSVLYSPEHTRGAPLTRKPGNSLAHWVDGNIMMDTGGRQRKLGFHTTLLMAVTGTVANHLGGCSL